MPRQRKPFLNVQFEKKGIQVLAQLEPFTKGYHDREKIGTRGELLVHQLLIVPWLDDIIRKVDQKLREAAFCCSIVAENGREGGITERLWKALTQRFASTSIVAKAVVLSKNES